MKLYTHHHSANGRKVLAISYHLKLESEIILVNIYQGDGQKPDYLKINPFGIGAAPPLPTSADCIACRKWRVCCPNNCN